MVARNEFMSDPGISGIAHILVHNIGELAREAGLETPQPGMTKTARRANEDS